MFTSFKDFLLNIFIILSPLLVYPYLYKYRTDNGLSIYRVCLYVLFSFALLLSMSFPVNLHGLIYDFRSVPLVLGSLYGGPVVSLLLYVTLIVYRWLLGNDHNLIYALSLLSSFPVVYFFLRNVHARKLYAKMAVAILLCTSVKAITFGLYLSMTNGLWLLLGQLASTVETYLLQAVITGLCVYLIEFLHSYFRMQEEMIRSEKTKIVSEMAAAVAHEIRNPLTTVRGFIQLFGAEDLDKQKREFYHKICLEELDRAQQIITDYLSLAKPDPEVIEIISVTDEIHYLSNVLTTYANYNNILIQGNVPQEGSLCIVGDRYKFRQALINIGKNAIEALQEGGLLEMTATSEDDQVLLVIRDTGVGMTREQIQRLGTPYYSTKEKGTGLGTMVSYGIIKKMSGKIEISSQPGVGTEYRLVFPLVEAG